MSDQPNPAASEPNTAAEPNKTDTQAQEHMIPKSRFDDVLKRAQEAEKALQAREAAERAAQEKQAAERGEWEQVATERQRKLTEAEATAQARGERLAALEAEMERQVAQMKKALPEDLRDLVPDGDVLQRFAWLSKAASAAAKLTAAPQPLGTPAGPRGPGSIASATNGDSLAAKRAHGDYSL